MLFHLLVANRPHSSYPSCKSMLWCQRREEWTELQARGRHWNNPNHRQPRRKMAGQNCQGVMWVPLPGFKASRACLYLPLPPPTSSIHPSLSPPLSLCCFFIVFWLFFEISYNMFLSYSPSLPKLFPDSTSLSFSTIFVGFFPLSFPHKYQFMLPKYSWMCGLSLDCGLYHGLYS